MTFKEITIKAKDGADINAVTSRVGDDAARGLVVVCHGFGEHTGRYQALADYLGRAGYASVVFDQRGHGKPPGLPIGKRNKFHGTIPGYQSFLDDINSVTAAMKNLAGRTPLVLYGHSMGGNIAANYVLRHNPSEFACAVLEAPWLGFYVSGKKIAPPIGLVRFLSRLFPNAPLPGWLTKLPITEITNDASIQTAINDDPLCHFRMTLRMLSGICDGFGYALNNAAGLNVPTLVALAENDTIVSNRAIRAFVQAAGRAIPSGHFKSYNTLHSIHNDTNSETFLNDLVSFLDGHCR